LILDTLQWLQGTRLAVSISEYWFPFVESLHVITMAIVAGTIFIVDTRLIGLTSTQLSFSYVSERLLPWTWGAFCCSVVTGTLMFIGNATGYYDNTAFRVKMALLLCAGLNMFFFQYVTFRGVSSWDLGRPPATARLAGVISVTLWCGVIGFGRWIGFTA
jgi:hypothetical protein